MMMDMRIHNMLTAFAAADLGGDAVAEKGETADALVIKNGHVSNGIEKAVDTPKIEKKILPGKLESV